MTETSWKVVMDRDGVTISGDQFRLTTNGSDPGSLDTVVSELQSMTRTTYGQYCGLSRAIEMVGERWGLLIVRDLLVSGRSVTELHKGLPRVPAKMLSMRLKEMAYSGIIRKSGELDETGDERYELTDYGRALEEIMFALGRWGSATLAMPRPEDIVTEDSMMVALRATFLPDEAAGQSLAVELHIADVVVHAKVDDGRIEVGRGPLPGADTVIDPGPLLKALLTRTMSVSEALAGGQVSMTGNPALLEKFVSMFRLPTFPEPERTIL